MTNTCRPIVMTYTKLIGETELIKRKTKNDENKELKYKREKHEYESVLKSFKADIDSNKIY